MSLRETLNKNPALAGGIVVVVIVAAVVAMRGSSGAPPLDQAWFYDLQTGALFPGDRFAPAPIDAPSGAGNGVTAVVLGCGDCEAKPTKAHWLEKFTPEALAVHKKMEAADAAEEDDAIIVTEQEQQVYDAGQLIALPPEPGSEPQWVPSLSGEGEAIRSQQIKSACTSGKPEVCLPGKG